MCMQCVTGASVAAGATATGLIAWLHTRAPSWLTARRLKLATAFVVFLGVIAASVQF